MSQKWRVSQLLLGIEGLALLRRWLTGNAGEIDARVREIEELCRRYRDPSPGDVIDVEREDADPPAGYDALAEIYDHVDNSLIATEEPPMRALLDALPIGRVLDAACGTGRHTAHLVDRGHSVTGVDGSWSMLRQAAAKAPTASLVRGSLTALPVATNSHDAALCALALSHLPDVRPAIRELARVVRPGGDVVLSDIHPLVPLTGGQAAALVGEGRVAVVRNHSHLVSDYLAAFSAAALEIVGCAEPLYDAARYGAQGSLADIEEATAMALDGLPFALLWHLRKRS
jgi:ubiquinone/menaquinone biosynthesis C-methylase UbiE